MEKLIGFIWYLILMVCSIIAITFIFKNFEYNKSAFKSYNDKMNFAIEQLTNNK